MVFICFMIVGVGWEIFEFVNGIAQSTEGYIPDTLTDLAMDAVGSLVAGFLASKKKHG